MERKKHNSANNEEVFNFNIRFIEKLPLLGCNLFYHFNTEHREEKFKKKSPFRCYEYLAEKCNDATWCYLVAQLLSFNSTWFNQTFHNDVVIHLSIEENGIKRKVRGFVKKTQIFYGQADRKGEGFSPLLGPDRMQIWKFWPTKKGINIVFGPKSICFFAHPKKLQKADKSYKILEKYKML